MSTAHQSVRSSAPVVSRCFPGGYNVKLYISRGRLAWWLLAFLHRGAEQYWKAIVDVYSRACTMWTYRRKTFCIGSCDIINIAIEQQWAYMPTCPYRLRNSRLKHICYFISHEKGFAEQGCYVIYTSPT